MAGSGTQLREAILVNEAMIEDLFPFLLMFGAMGVMGVIAVFFWIRRSIEDRVEYGTDRERDQEGSAQMGSTFNG